jgi:hypothetical protein
VKARQGEGGEESGAHAKIFWNCLHSMYS